MSVVGRILLMPKGDYNASTVYNALDWVRYGGASWVCTTDNTVGIAPTTSTPQWQLLAEDGTVGGWTSISNKPFEDIGKGLTVPTSGADQDKLMIDLGDNLHFDANKLDVIVKNTYIGTGTSSDRPISGQGVKNAISTTKLNDLADVISNLEQEGDVLTFDSAQSKYVNKQPDKSLARYGGSLTFADLTNALLTAANEDKFYLVTDGGTIQSADAGNWILPAGSVIPADSHIAVVNTGISSNPVYKFDDFGGYVDISGKAEKSFVEAMNRRSRRDITSEVTADNGATLFAAIDEQNLAKYGFAVGDYFVGSTRTLKYQTGNDSTETNGSYKLQYILADMNTWYGGYDSYEVVGSNHISLLINPVPATSGGAVLTRQWNSAADITSVGYNISPLYNFLKGSFLDAVKADLKAIFGGSTGLEHLIQHQLYLTKSFSACEWTTLYIHTPSEVEIYGSNIFGGNDYQKYAFNKKLAIFDKFRFNEIFGNKHIWLCNMYSAASACYADSAGFAYRSSPVGTVGCAGLVLLKH